MMNLSKFSQILTAVMKVGFSSGWFSVQATLPAFFSSHNKKKTFFRSLIFEEIIAFFQFEKNESIFLGRFEKGSISLNNGP